MKTTIIRIEDTLTELGMFRSELVDELSNSGEFRRRHGSFPTPYEDKKIGRFIEVDEFCAFQSIDQMLNWVTTAEIREFISLGADVLMLEVSDCIVGEYQIIFKKEDIIKTTIINDLF